MSTEAHERRVRRQAHAQGFRLRKLRNDDGYWLIDIATCGLSPVKRSHGVFVSAMSWTPFRDG
jgi:hypothetical protein